MPSLSIDIPKTDTKWSDNEITETIDYNNPDLVFVMCFHKFTTSDPNFSYMEPDILEIKQNEEDNTKTDIRIKVIQIPEVLRLSVLYTNE